MKQPLIDPIDAALSTGSERREFTIIPAEKEDKRACTLAVEYGIRDLRPGQHFFVTGTVYATTNPDILRRNPDNIPDHLFLRGGCIHETIEAYCPRFRDLIRFHLRQEDGAPSYAVEKGMYYVNAAIFGKGKLSHLDKAAGKKALANHMLFTDEQTAELLAQIIEIQTEAERRDFFAQVVEEQRQRWAAEALQIKRKYNIPHVNYCE